MALERRQKYDLFKMSNANIKRNMNVINQITMGNATILDPVLILEDACEHTKKFFKTDKVIPLRDFDCYFMEIFDESARSFEDQFS